ncbi:hypothetical protein TWF102_002999 [Orbilia oligospora]|uniref:Uncharacterized protein n=1 Tax=Orbilia oligospora TaxID=2813651 RepID=A0A7C8NTJ9_ORBOL|nr:hypothetical protein TWF102_002999 [Orbilia oligospora]
MVRRLPWKRDTTEKAQEWYPNETVSHTESQPPGWVALRLDGKVTPRKLKGRTANGIAEKGAGWSQSSHLRTPGSLISLRQGGISGSTVNALAIVTQLNAFENGWRDLYKNLGRGMIEGVMLAAFSNILSADLNAGVYHVYNNRDPS